MSFLSLLGSHKSLVTKIDVASIGFSFEKYFEGF